MAQYFLSATDTNVLSRLTAREGSSISVVDDAGTTAILLQRVAGNIQYASLNDADASTDVDIIARGRSDNSRSTQSFGAVARFSGGSGYGGHDLSGDDGSVTRYDAGTRNSLFLAYSLVADTQQYHWIRFNVSGGNLKFKSWDGAVGDQPATWDAETSDSTYAAAGLAGLGSHDGNFYFTDLGIGTGGDSAPTQAATPTVQTIRKGSTFDIETTLGTITTATLNSVNVFDHVTGQVGTTVSFAGAATDEITTSGEYDLVLGDGTGTETITVQVNVYGVAPSNNPLQKDGSALASLTGVQVRITDGSDLNGAQLEYLPAATTDASGNLGNIDLSSTAAADTDPVLLHMRTSAGDSIISDETVGLI